MSKIDDARYRMRWATPLGDAPTAQQIIEQDRQVWSLTGSPTTQRPRGSFLPEQIRALRAWRPRAGTGELRWMAEQLGTSLTSLYNIRARVTYRHVSGPAGQFAPDPENPPRAARKRGPAGRLTDDQVRRIRSTRPVHGERTLETLAVTLRISMRHLYDIRKYHAYRHVLSDEEMQLVDEVEASRRQNRDS